MRRFEKNIDDRKLLVARISELTGVESRYTRMPRCAYEIGAFTVERDGSLTAAEEKRNPIKQVTDFIDANFMHDIKVENIADMLHLNRKYLVRIFRRKTGLSIKEYLTDKRLREAKKFLSEGFGVSETAAMTGYGDSFNFSKAFKKKYGDPPKKYIN